MAETLPYQARNNSYNKYRGNYGPCTGTTPSKRGLSLDRSRGRQSQAGYGYGQGPGLVRA